MNFPLRHTYGLVTRGQAGLACDKDGLALGDVELTRIPLNADQLRYCVVRPAGEVGEILQAAYGPQTDETIERICRGLDRAASLIETGDLGRAGIEAVKLGLPELSLDGMAKLAHIADLEKAGSSWQNQPRVPAGQSGGGEWTSDGGGGGTAVPTKPSRQPTETIRPERVKPLSSSNHDGVKPIRTAPDTIDGFKPTGGALLMPASMVTTAPAGSVFQPKPLASPIRLPVPSPSSLVIAGAAWLDGWTEWSGQQQVNHVVAHFGLDPKRNADMAAARTYVFAHQYLPAAMPDFPWSGEALDAASQAAMRFALINPTVDTAPNLKLFNQMISAATWGLEDYQVESRARPPGVPRELQTTSEAARAAAVDTMQNKDMWVHHLVPAETWGIYKEVAAIAQNAGWNPNNPSNLIWLPADKEMQAELGGELPLHNTAHPNYNKEIWSLIDVELSRLPNPRSPTPLQARSILDDVAARARAKIVGGGYGDKITVAI